MKKFILLLLSILSLPVLSQTTEDETVSFRIRADFNIELDEDSGWAAQINQPAEITVDQPFRLRFEVENRTIHKRKQYNLQFQHNDGSWEYAEAHEFPYESMASPVTSIVSSPGFYNGAEADNLLNGSVLTSDLGAGIALAASTPGWTVTDPQGASAEFEWALVVRNWSDGPAQIKSGDRIRYRMVDQAGNPLKGRTAEITVKVPEYHLGGTFVETPYRIGPWETKKGHLYFIMEPTETYNVFMMMKSVDSGKTWQEIDGKNRPEADDLEGVASVFDKEGVIHIIHQQSSVLFYHAFDTKTDSWTVDSQKILEHPEPPTQVCDVIIKADGTLITAFGYGNGIAYTVKEKNKNWEKPQIITNDEGSYLTNPLLAVDKKGTVDLIYKDSNGNGWHRNILNRKTTASSKIITGMGTKDSENVAILPLIFDENRNIFLIYRNADGYLNLMKFANKKWTEPVKITDHKVISNSEDSDQTGADAVFYNGQILLTSIDETDRTVYFSKLDSNGKILSNSVVMSGSRNSWVRGQILKNQPNSPFYGVVIDTGSKGGSGFNKFVILQVEE